MRKIFLFLIVVFAFSQTHAQYVHKIKADSVLITNDSCTAELNLENSTKHVKGFLYNKGNGRTEFRKVVKLNDSTFIFGGDTLVIGGSAAWSLQGNSGTNALTNFIGTTDSQALVMRTKNLERMRISANGFVGIGTNSPASFLHIVDESHSNNPPLNVRVNSNGFPHFRFTNINGGQFAGAGALYENNISEFLQYFMTSSTNSFSPSRVFIRSTGANGMKVSTDKGLIQFQVGTIIATGLADTANVKMEIDSFGVRLKKADLVTYDTATYQTLVINKSNGRIAKANNTMAGSGWSLTGNAGTNPATNFLGTIDSQDVVIRTNNAERVRVSTNGKVGIGTANPIYKLDMRGSSDSTYAMMHLSRDTDDNGGYIGITQHPVLLLSAAATPNSYNGNWIAKGNSAAMMSIAAGNSNLNPNFGFFINSGLTPGASFSPLTLMQMNGGDAYGSMRGVGIGTSVSWHRVHVQNTDSNVMGLRNTAALSAVSGAMLRMYNSGTPSAQDQRLGALAWGTGASITGMRTGARIQGFSEAAWTDNASHPTYLTFETVNNNSTTPEERMRITAAGNVGIGTSTPTKKLHIIGQGLFSDTITAQKNVSVTGNIDVTQGVLNMTATGISPFINITGNQNGWPRIVITNVANTASAGAGSLYLNNAGHMLQQYVGSSINAFVPAGALIRSSGPGGLAIVTDSGVIAFGKDPHIGTNEFARFLTNGNLGIGTLTPAYKLDVNGKLGVRTIDSTAEAANVLYQDAATGEIKKAAYVQKQTFAQTATGSVTGTDNETTLIASGTGNLSIPASVLTVGKSYKVTVYGVYSTSASDPSNITLRLKFGSITIASSGAIFLGSGKSNVPFTLQATITCRSTGSSGTIYTFGNVFRDGNVDPITNGTSASTINTTVSQTLDVTGQLSDSSSGNVVSAYIVTLESIN